MAPTEPPAEDRIGTEQSSIIKNLLSERKVTAFSMHLCCCGKQVLTGTLRLDISKMSDRETFYGESVHGASTHRVGTCVRVALRQIR